MSKAFSRSNLTRIRGFFFSLVKYIVWAAYWAMIMLLWIFLLERKVDYSWLINFWKKCFNLLVTTLAKILYLTFDKAIGKNY